MMTAYHRIVLTFLHLRCKTFEVTPECYGDFLRVSFGQNRPPIHLKRRGTSQRYKSALPFRPISYGHQYQVTSPNKFLFVPTC